MLKKFPAPKKWYLFPSGYSPVKCDRPGCDYRKEDIQIKDFESYLYISCPKCGAPLLTVEDWNVMINVNKVIGFPLIRFINWFGINVLKKELHKYHVSFDGKGNPSVEEII
jgi:hypothetical protein